MIPQIPSNTIDFDTAKLQRLGYAPAPRRQPARSVSLIELRQQLALQLQTSLEVDRVIGLFFQHLQHLVPLDSLAYRLDSADLRLELGERASHSAGYHLNHGNEYFGELVFRRRTRFSEIELGQLESLLASLLFPLRNALLYRAAVRSALRDGLTDTGNRIALNQALQRDIELARRSGQPLAALMLDIDHFKSINDRFGHATGDEVLKAVASALKASLRNADMVFRYGGEEFFVLLANTRSEAAQLVGERLRLAIENLQYLVEGQPLQVSISLGCASLQPGEGSDSLQQRADAALYSAKRSGRNRLAMAG